MKKAIPLLDIQDLCVGFKKGAEILRGVDFRIFSGERVAFVGESGCGKTITALSVLGLLPEKIHLKKGMFRWEGAPFFHGSREVLRDFRGRRVAMIFQDPLSALNPVFTAGEQVLEVFKTHRLCPPREARKRVLDLFQEVGLSDPERVFSSYPHQLSGGMAQRVMIAMALAASPQLMIADEPTSALDVTVQAQILELLIEHSKRHGTALWFITHDLRLVRRFADRVAILYAGQVVEESETRRLFSDPLHPYTQGLLASDPALVPRGQRLPFISGRPPRPGEIRQGCAFAPRCPRVQENCRQVLPALEKRKDHPVRCFYP